MYGIYAYIDPFSACRQICQSHGVAGKERSAKLSLSAAALSILGCDHVFAEVLLVKAKSQAQNDKTSSSPPFLLLFKPNLAGEVQNLPDLVHKFQCKQAARLCRKLPSRRLP